jgi:hypothetical protein
VPLSIDFKGNNRRVACVNKLSDQTGPVSACLSQQHCSAGRRRSPIEDTMMLRDLFRLMKAAPALALGAVIALLPKAALAALAATATIASSPNSNGTFHYELVLSNTGSTTIGTFWYAWIPGANYMQATPTNVTAPSGWQANLITGGGTSIQYVTSSSLLAAGGTLSGFSFDSPLTPAQMTGPSSGGNFVDTSFVYIAAPLADPGVKFVPTTAPAGPAPSTAVASVLPGGRSVEVGTTATVFASMINTSASALSGCQVALPGSAPAGLSMAYQTTDPTTNALTGSPNTPVAIGGNGTQTFVLSFTSSGAVTADDLALQFSCSGQAAVTSINGLNTVDLLFSSTPIPDVIALAATATNNGIVAVPVGGAGAFAVASDNAGADGTLTVAADTGSATLPLAVNVCETTSAGQCMAAPAASVTLDDTAGATPTFSVFINASSAVALDPANSRIFLRFKDAGGVSHGSTSVAVQAN